MTWTSQKTRNAYDLLELRDFWQDKGRHLTNNSRAAVQYSKKNTITDIKSTKVKIRSFVINTIKELDTRKILTNPENPQLEDAFFTEHWRNNFNFTDEMLMEMAKFFHERLGRGILIASRGWLDNFKERPGIRQLKLTGGRTNADQEHNDNESYSAKPYQSKTWRLDRKLISQVPNRNTQMK